MTIVAEGMVTVAAVGMITVVEAVAVEATEMAVGVMEMEIKIKLVDSPLG